LGRGRKEGKEGKRAPALEEGSSFVVVVVVEEESFFLRTMYYVRLGKTGRGNSGTYPKWRLNFDGL
jgi:hypothetical protein